MHIHLYLKEGQDIMLSEKSKSQSNLIYNRMQFLKKCICVINFWKNTF